MDEKISLRNKRMKADPLYKYIIDTLPVTLLRLLVEHMTLDVAVYSDDLLYIIHA